LAPEYPAEICSGCLLCAVLLEEDEPEISPTVTALKPSPRLCGDYQLLDQIGRGACGVVYKARKVSLKKVCALKLLIHADTATAEELERLRIEAETAARIRHPNILPVFDFGECNGQHYIAMELINGQDLKQRLATNEFRIPASRDAKPRAREMQRNIARLMSAVARAVDHAHQCGFLHRDIKPSNILLDEKGQPYLGDFGLAKALDGSRSISKPGTVLGTFDYMSPEQAEGKRVGFPTDIFSLGAVLYELLTGQAPFHGDSIGETLRRLQETDPQEPRSFCQWIDTDLATICLKCLEKDPNLRYASAGNLADDLDNWLADKPVRARPVRFVGRVKRWCRREPKIAAMAAGLFLLVTAVATLTSILLVLMKSHVTEMEYSPEHLRQVLINRIERDRNEDAPIRIFSEEISIITRHGPINDGTEKPLTLAARTRERNADRMVPPFGYFVQCLQTNLWQQAELPARFDLVLHYSEASSQDSALAGSADLFRLDPAAYVVTRKKMPALTPLARESYDEGKPVLHGAIVTHPTSGITNLSQLNGSIAFGEKDTAMGWYLPRAALANAGLRKRDFTVLTNLSFASALNAVREGRVKAGVVLQEDLDGLARAGVSLRILQSFESSGPVWVVSPKLDTQTATALGEVLLSLRDRAVLTWLEPRLTGFVTARPSDFDELERQIEAANTFDSP
jgi:ABC-type phosphate/phosphonate transport system substrate-binding protein/tRNA A-37 threonylcarbamoyl transferase component Bud32